MVHNFSMSKIRCGHLVGFCGVVYKEERIRCVPHTLTLKIHFEYGKNRNQYDENINKVSGLQLHDKEDYTINVIYMQ